jgi:hypothetical protein
MTHWLRASLLVLALVIAAAAAPLAQGRAGGAAPPSQLPVNPNQAPTEAGTGAISGVVIDGATKTPIANAVVYLGPPQHGPPDTPVRTLSDAKGRYVFRNLPAFGGYFIQATKFGYFNASYGRGSSGAVGGRVALTDGQWFSEGNIIMWRPGAISGRVLDQAGEPAVAVYVRVLPRILIAGRPHFASGTVTQTDDRGVYRIANLGPGAYLVQVPSVQSSVPVSAAVAQEAPPPSDGRPAASRDPMAETAGSRVQLARYTTPIAPVNGRTAVYPPTFSPGVTSTADAQVIQLGQSEERTGVDIALKPVPAFTVSGVVDGPAEAITNLTLRLMPEGLADLGGGSEAATVLVGADGRFTFLNVPGGSFTLVAGRTTTEYSFRNLGSQSKTLPAAPRPAGVFGGSMASYGVIAGPSGTSMSSWRYSDADDVYVARVPMSVSSDRSDVVVTLRRTATLTGRIVWAEGEEAPSPPAGMPAAFSAPRVALFPAGGQAFLGLPRSRDVRPGDAAPSDRVIIAGLQAGEYVLSVSSPAGRIQSVTWNGRDYTNRPFDATSGEDIADVVVTMTTKSILLSGMVRNERGLPDDEAAVIVFPAERDQWSNYGLQPDRIKAIATTNTGAYRFQSLAAGEYLAVAVHIDLIDGWKDPAFLEKVSRLATRVTLAWSDNKTQDLRVSVVK